jgi:light-regulated signal transduction histidine kinase (bacteriophytochrome)
MTDLIEGLLTLARVTRGSLRLQPVDLSVLARQVVDRLRYLSPERHVNVVMPDGIVAIADRRLILVVLDNLLENAWKFTANRAVANIEFGRRVVDDRMTYFVRDDGAGFEMEFVDKLFGVFQRLHAASEFEGTGIGLATVKRIVRRHGGNIWAEGAVGRGATFSFTIGEEVVA